IEAINDVEQFLVDIWHDIAGFVSESAVYINHAATECLHWHTGGKIHSFFKDAGATSVLELDMYNFRVCDYVVKICFCSQNIFSRVVIISTSTDPDFYQRTVKMILEKNAFEHCTIITAAHSSMLNYEDSDCSVTLLFRPIFISLIDSGLFVTPPFSNLLSPLNNALLKNSEYAVDHFVSLFNSLLTYLNLKEDIYSVGKFGEYVAEKLETLPTAIDRRNSVIAAKGKGVSLIFVDRVLDLCTSTSNNTESLLSRILCTLPHLPHHYNDVAINMSPLFCGSQKFVDIPGCLASNDKTLMNILITKKQKDVLATMNKLLVDILSTKENLKLKENLKPKLGTRISAHSLEKLINKFQDIADLHTISESSKKLQVCGIMLSNIIKTREKRGLDTDNILALLVHIYALAGTEIQFSLQQEQQLEEAITDAVFEDITKLKENTTNSKLSMYQQTLSLFDVTEAETIKETSVKIANHIMKTLHEIAQQRAPLHTYNSLMSKSSSQEIFQRIGILQQLLTDILQSNRHELPDLHQRSRSFISAGFNLLSKGRIKHHPCDNNWIIIYVIGGITPEEIRETKEIISLFNTNCQITIAGSRLLNPLDIVDKVLLSLINY
ncbi:Sec1 family domain-containing protein 2, partial [Cyphomyrmex costatus]